MPPLIIPVLTAIGISGTIGGLSVVSFIAEGVTLGGIFALGLLGRQKTAGEPATAGRQETTKQATPPRVRVYGQVKIGAALYFQSAPTILSRGFYLCDGPIDAVAEIWLGDVATSFAPSSGATQFGLAGKFPWWELIEFYVQTGTIPQTRNTGFFEYSWWDSTHAGNGLANILMHCRLPYDPQNNFSKSYPSGIPPLRAVVRGAKIFDPRDAAQTWTDPGTWKYSDNPALCILDFLTGSRGYNIPNSRIGISSFSAFADVCDALVLRYDGATEKRYRCWGSYRLDEEPRSVLERLLMTCDGDLFQQGNGTIAIRGGVFVSPTVTIGDGIILGYDVQAGPDKLSMFNQYRPRYTEPTQDYQLIESAPLDDIAAQAAAGGQVIAQDLQLPFAPSDWQALRLAKIYMAQNNPEWAIKVTASIAGLDALSERIVHLTIGELGIDGDFLVKKFDVAGDLKSCEISLSSLHADAYDIAPSVNDLVSGIGTLAGSAAIPDVTGLTVTQIDTTVSGATVTRLQAGVTPPSTSGFSLNAQLSRDAGLSYRDMAGNGHYTAISDILCEGSYSIRAAFHLALGSDGAFAGPVITPLDSQRLGPAAVTLSNRLAMDFGLASAAIDTFDSFGLASTGSVPAIDLGLASA